MGLYFDCDKANRKLFLFIEFTMLLIDHGADVYAKDKYNQTPVDYATFPKGKLINKITNKYK